MELLQHVTLNWSVILSLFLTIYVSLAVLHTGNAAYVGSHQESSFTVDADDDSWAWGDLASFAWPLDEEARHGLRRGLYVAECVFVGFGFSVSFLGLMNVVLLYSAFGTGIPDVLGKLEYLIRNRNSTTFMWASFDLSLFSLMLSVGFAAARASAIMCFSIFGCVPAFATIGNVMMGFHRRSSTGSMYVIMHRRAHRLFNTADGAQ